MHALRWLNTARVVALAVIFVTVVRVAWIGDDALITLRSALNITHGWGVGFNATEAVASYTHPLWFLLWSALGPMFPSWIAANFAMSIGLSMLAVALVLWHARSIGMVVVLAGALLISSAFIDYTTSGLETPLALVVVGVLILLARKPMSRDLVQALLVGLTCAAVILVRLDLALLIAPVVLYLLWQWRRSLPQLGAFVVGSLVPVVIWLTWSWASYSSLLPNTFAAKTNVEIPRSELIVQGLRYLEVSTLRDIGTLVILVVGSGLLIRFGAVWQRTLVAGVALYLLYVVWVGGDFMVGRFLAVPTYAVVLGLALTLSHLWGEVKRPVAMPLVALTSAVVAFALAAFAFVPPTSVVRNPAQKWAGVYGIVDERGVYAELGRGLHAWWLDTRATSAAPFEFAGVGEANPWERLALYDAAAAAWPMNEGPRLTTPDDVGVVCWLGGVAIMTGPRVHWIDTCALADRFLAESPSRQEDWRIGHFKRDIPEGYVDAVAQGSSDLVTDVADRQRLADLWSRIRD